MPETTGSKPTLHDRLREEMWKFGIISAYLFVCFLVLELYRLSLLTEQGVHAWKMGLALGKAMIIAKFILLGEAAKVGTRVYAKTVWHRIVWKSLLFWLTLIVLTLLEEIIIGWVHGHSSLQTLKEYFDHPLIANIAPSLVMLLILIPMITFTELNRALGVGVLKSVLQTKE